MDAAEYFCLCSVDLLVDFLRGTGPLYWVYGMTRFNVQNAELSEQGYSIGALWRPTVTLKCPGSVLAVGISFSLIFIKGE
jgi:hypothetical protein